MHIIARKVINPDRSLRGGSAISGLPQGLNRSRGRPSISFSPVRRLTERTGKLNYAKKGHYRGGGANHDSSRRVS
jgi:hypothetical protein